MAHDPASTKRTTRVLVGLTAVGVGVFAVAGGFLAWSLMGGGTSVSDGTWLHVNLSGALSDAPQPAGLFDDPNLVPALPTEMARALRAAATDDRVDGVLLELEASSMGWATATELRDALVELREAGKPCVAWSELYTTGMWYLASACDDVLIAPSGVAMINGMSVEVTYYAGTFEKIGVVPEFEHVGDFKTAVEPYERTGPSEPAAVSYEMLVDGIFDEMLAKTSASRGRTPEEVRAMLDAAPMSPAAATEVGLLDGTAYLDALAARLPEHGADGWRARLLDPVTKEEREAVEDRFTSIDDYVQEMRAGASFGDSIAVVYAEGPIMPGSGEGGMFGDSVLSDGEMVDWLSDIRDDDSVKAVVLRVNSPGGSTTASDNMLRAIEGVKATGRPVVVSMGDYAASGGYYISAPADWIVAQPTTITGSIGVLGGKFNILGTYEKIGLSVHQFKRGALATDLGPTTAMSEAGRAVYKGYMEEFYALFLGHVAEGRKMDVAAVHEIAQGRVWTGRQALERGLVDELGSVDVAVAKAAELASLAEGSYALDVYPKRRSAFEVLMEDLASAEAPTVRVDVPEVLAAPLAELSVLEGVLGDAGVAIWMPGRLSF
jgi:protease-4